MGPKVGGGQKLDRDEQIHLPPPFNVVALFQGSDALVAAKILTNRKIHKRRSC
jgi:hypothetical protein